MAGPAGFPLNIERQGTSISLWGCRRGSKFVVGKKLLERRSSRDYDGQPGAGRVWQLLDKSACV